MAKFARVRTPYAPPSKKQAPTVGIIAFEALAIKYARYKGGTSQFLANGQTGRDAPFLLDFSRYDHKSQKNAKFSKKLQNTACFIPQKVYNKSMKESTTQQTEDKKMYKVINNRTNEVMERFDTMTEAKEAKEQYNELGSWQDAFGNNEYYGTYRIELS